MPREDGQERCGFCHDGIIRNHPANGEDGWCPYCDGTGVVGGVLAHGVLHSESGTCPIDKERFS